MMPTFGQPNARYEPLPEAGAERTLLAVGSIPWFGWACHSAAIQVEGTTKIARVAQPPPSLAGLALDVHAPERDAPYA
jgi:hypothetical protein